jgi:hypothetical protein
MAYLLESEENAMRLACLSEITHAVNRHFCVSDAIIVNAFKSSVFAALQDYDTKRTDYIKKLEEQFQARAHANATSQITLSGTRTVHTFRAITHRYIPPLSREDADWFWSMVQIGSDEECWPWIAGSHDRKGYGQLKINRRTWTATRVAFKLMYGGDPWPLDILHHCNFPPCTNPHHFSLGTRADNNHDTKRKGRTARGERHSQAVNSEKDVLEMIDLRKYGFTYKEIGEMYYVEPMTVWHAVHPRGKSWRWLK